jgi:hypothetical protein
VEKQAWLVSLALKSHGLFLFTGVRIFRGCGKKESPQAVKPAGWRINNLKLD